MSKRKHGAENGVETVTNGANSKRARTNEQIAYSHELLGESFPDGSRDMMPVNGNPRDPKKLSRDAKLERRRIKRNSKTTSSIPETGAKSHYKAKHKNKDPDNASPSWNVSGPIGGRLIDLDPVFSVDEQYLLLAYESSVGIYAASTSLRIRTLRTSKAGTVTGFTIAPHQTSHIYISTSSGLIEEWNWMDGQRLGRWDIRSNISGLASSGDILYTIDHKEQWMITAHRLRIGDTAELSTLFKSSEPISHLKALDGGSVIVASAGQKLILGNTTDSRPVSLKKTSYTWREFECSEWITSLDAWTDLQESPTSDSLNLQIAHPKPNAIPSVNIAAGGLKGSIYVYHDLLEKLKRMERAVDSIVLISRHLHWHRNAVGAVKWSLDGNYIISGGSETTMVLWQLDTGHKQFLPHLSAAIESIVVSPSGTSYAVRLSSNAAMVISTTELQPTVSISGIQISLPSKSVIQPPQMASVTKFNHSVSTDSRILAVTNPMGGDGQILLAVPAASSPRSGLPTSPSNVFLQTLETRSGLQISRQALTRTKITTLNIGPESNIIEEPNVVLLQLSNDGKWIATVEEWMPPIQDIKSLAVDRIAENFEQDSRIEIFLKFWTLNSENHTWELVSRIDGPHADASSFGASGRVLDMASDTLSIGFTTVGYDGLVKSWKPRIRYRDGMKVRGKDSKPLTSWACQYSTPLPTAEGDCRDLNSSRPSAKASISKDGSLLVVGYQSGAGSTIHLIDAGTGEIHYTRSDLLSSVLLEIGILDRYLILLSNDLVVWDLVDDRVNYGFSIRTHGLQRKREIAATHLAVDQQNQTFALAIPEIGQYKTKVMTRLAIFDPSKPNPIFITSLPQTLKGLLPAASQKGYLAINNLAEIQSITPSPPLYQQTLHPPKVDQISTAGLENLFKSNSAQKEDSVTNFIADINAGDDVVVRQHQLADIFEVGPSFALPSVTDLFEQVAQLFVTSRPDK